MSRKYMLFVLFALFCSRVSYAIPTSSGVWAWWGYDGSKGYNGSAGDFIIAGGLGKGGAHGTHGDEWGVVAVVAEKIVEHGGYFCPYQIQCKNKKKKKRAWTVYYAPSGFNNSQCAWLCEPGYSGTNCLTQTSTPARCDKTPLNTGSGGKFAGVSMRTSGGDVENKEGLITAFKDWGDDKEHDVILGIVKYLEHGVMAGPVHVECNRDNWNSVDSYVESVGMATGNVKLLCAEGYRANASGTDCEPINQDVCNTQEMTFCTGFDRSKYNSSLHTLETVGDCVKYFCTEEDTAFVSNTDMTCAPCSTGVKGGSNTENGTCVKCDTGEYFDKTTNSCKSANAYSKTELQYGKDKTKDSEDDIDKQCWTYVIPDEYKICVEKGGSFNPTTDLKKAE